MAALAEGTEFAGYLIEGVAGQGGMGEVYRAQQLRPKRLVALKVIVPQLADDEEFRERFRREAEAAAQIEHPNVIPVYEVGEDSGRLFIAMRYVAGVDLKTLIERGDSIERRMHVLCQVASALDAAHERGLVHRDVKPSNILIADVGEQPHAYLTDFGVTKRLADRDLTLPGNLVGSVDYIAPEQIRGEELDARADVYSLTCVFYTALAAAVPFPGDGELAALQAHLDDPPPSLLDRRSDLPEAIDDVIRRGMAKDPADRYATAGELARAATEALAGGAAAPPAPPPREENLGLPPTQAKLSPEVAALLERTQSFVELTARTAEQRGRPELAGRLREEVARFDGRETCLVVAGEGGEGKSSLVNALLGEDLSPVGVGPTTKARLVFRGSPQDAARVYREGDDAPEPVEIQNIPALLSAAATAQGEGPVQVVELLLDRPLLRRGLTIVDTPGVGGLDSAHATVTLSALSSADALLFVSDAAAPLSQPEASFLEQATERIGTIIFALTKRDLYGGWKTILSENAKILEGRGGRHAGTRLIAVSSRAELAAAAARAGGDASAAEGLAAQSGFKELRRALGEEVLLGGEVLRIRNVLQASRNVLAQLRMADESALAAGADSAELKSALRSVTASRDEFARSKRIGTVALNDEFSLLGQELNRELNRSLAELRTGYEELVRGNKLKPEDVSESLEADLRADLAKLDDLLQERLSALVKRLAGEMGIGLPLGFDRLDMPTEILAPPESSGDHPDGLARVTGMMPAFFGAAALPGLVGSLAIVLPVAAPIAPVAAVVGLSLIPLNIVQRRRTKTQGDALRVVRESAEFARIEIPPLVTKCLLSVRRQIESDLQDAIAERERELAAAYERQRRLAEADSQSRARARQEAQARIKALHALRASADALDNEAVAVARTRHDNG